MATPQTIDSITSGSHQSFAEGGCAMDRAAARIAARGHIIVSSSPVLVVDREGSVILDPREERRIIPGEPDEADRDVLALHAALATERERREAAEAAVVTLREEVEQLRDCRLNLIKMIGSLVARLNDLEQRSVDRSGSCE
jgi:hypothetical protein